MTGAGQGAGKRAHSAVHVWHSWGVHEANSPQLGQHVLRHLPLPLLGTPAGTCSPHMCFISYPVGKALEYVSLHRLQ